MAIENKGFVDERDNYRYVFKSSEFTKDELNNFSGVLTFNYYIEGQFDKPVNQYVLVLPDWAAQELYLGWNDLRIAYEKLVMQLDITVELPESMNWELFE